ncbi:hypothetical protein StoSoilB13_04240 [Arthrobacter sp. StoSoilB13]|nr:hypothetical protein StoSoilB13_04240 [Arthrobacter sp. StoSoilB13]
MECDLSSSPIYKEVFSPSCQRDPHAKGEAPAGPVPWQTPVRCYRQILEIRVNRR